MVAQFVRPRKTIRQLCNLLIEFKASNYLETIFTHNVTAEELDEIGPNYSGLDEGQYIDDLVLRAKASGSNVDYESLVDLQHLFNMRKDIPKFDHYTSVLETKHADLINVLFNE